MNVFTFQRATSTDDEENSARLFTKLEPWVSYGRDYTYSLKKVRNPSKELYVAKLDGQFCGAVLLVTEGVLVAYLQCIAVEPAFQGKGLAKEIMKRTEERVFKDFPNLFLTVADFRLEAYNLYKRMGFEEVGIIKEYILPGVDEIMMRKTVEPANIFYKK